MQHLASSRFLLFNFFCKNSQLDSTARSQKLNLKFLLCYELLGVKLLILESITCKDNNNLIYRCSIKNYGSLLNK